MIIVPRHRELIEIAENKLSKVKQSWVDEQCIIDDLIINAHFTIRECIQINSSGHVIDGFVITDCRNFLYKGLSFFELLGGVSGTANPITLEF